MKIVSTGSTLSSPEFHAKKKRAKQRRRYFWTLGVVALVALLVFLSRQEKFLISVYDIEGEKTVSTEEIEQSVNQALSAKFLWLLPRSNFLIYPRSAVKEKLLREFPRFSSVNLALDGFQVLEIDVMEREPFALYCASVSTPAEASDCYFLDDNGFIFDRAPSFSGTVYFIYASKLPIVEPLGQEFMSAAEFKPLAQFIKSLPELGIEPLALEASADEFTLILPHDVRMLLRRPSDFALLHADLKAFIQHEAIRSQPDFLEKLEFLDLRTENKVFYRFKQ